MPKPLRMFAVIDDGMEIVLVRHQRKSAIREIGEFTGATWDATKRMGWRCVPVLVTIEGGKP